MFANYKSYHRTYKKHNIVVSENLVYIHVCKDRIDLARKKSFMCLITSIVSCVAPVLGYNDQSSSWQFPRTQSSIFHKEAWSPLLRVDTMDEVKLIRNTERRIQLQYKFITRVLVGRVGRVGVLTLAENISRSQTGRGTIPR